METEQMKEIISRLDKVSKTHPQAIVEHIIKRFQNELKKKK
tara:strand:- start:917 stop:1039 length:123 start_codon:yes stop_codon:yes gene_type:complete